MKRQIFLLFSLLLLCGCTALLEKQNLSKSSSSSALDNTSISYKNKKDSPKSKLSPEKILLEKSNIEAERGFTDGDEAGEELIGGLSGLDGAHESCEIAQNYWENGEIQKALDALDNAYSMLLKANDADDREKEDMRLMISKRILEIYASQKVNVAGRYDAIPILLNHYVREEIKSLLKGKFFINAYKRSGKYRAAIVEELEKAGLPVELSWLPLIESGFTVNALSSARALGLWQFIPSTGYKFGLKRDKYIDERLNPEKSTMAAIAYLKELHKMFGDWSTVLAAYNCGEGRVLNVIRSQKVNYLDNFWDLYEKLPRETAQYVPRFLATIHIVNNLEKYGIGVNDIQVDSPLEYETLSVSKQMSLKDIAQTIGTSLAVMKELNPELKQSVLPEGKYDLKIPLNKSAVLLSKLEEVPASSIPQHSAEPSSSSQSSKTHYVYHRVKKGESLSEIASSYNTDVKSILRTNKMHKRHYIVAGNILKIPQTKSYISGKQNKVKSRYLSTHVVKSGDSLWNIAKKYGISTKDIHKENNLAGAKLSIGQVLKIPRNSSNISEKKGKIYLRKYRVKDGDVPLGIAKQHNMSLENLFRVNRLNHQSKIYPGQELYVE